MDHLLTALLSSAPAGGFADASVRIYDLQRAAEQNSQNGLDADVPGSESTLLRGHSAAVYGIDYSHDGQLLFTSSGDTTVRLWSSELKACMVAYRCLLGSLTSALQS